MQVNDDTSDWFFPKLRDKGYFLIKASSAKAKNYKAGLYFEYKPESWTVRDGETAYDRIGYRHTLTVYNQMGIMLTSSSNTQTGHRPNSRTRATWNALENAMDGLEACKVKAPTN